MSRTSWKKEFLKVFERTGDSFENIKTTLSSEEMQKEFDNDYGGVEGAPFTAWSDKYVYFPICYDGSEWIGWVERNPCDTPSLHQGGG